jgi:hypothetical protein
MNIDIIKEELRKMEEAEEKMLLIAAYGTGNMEEDKMIVEKLFEVAQYIVEIKEIIKIMEEEGGQDE